MLPSSLAGFLFSRASWWRTGVPCRS